jgi:hypothetical protein
MPEDRPACLCVLCHDYGDRADADRMDLRMADQVRQHGWSVVMVPADDDGPGFAYTIGLWHSLGAPELALFGLEPGTMHTLLNDLGHKAAAGEVLAGGQRHRDIIETFPVALRQADLRWYRTFFGRAISFYRRPPFPVLEVVWPDAAGRFLWDPGTEPAYQVSQPQLWLRPADHPAGVWATLAAG